MKTKEEMVQFCDDNGLGKGFNKKWRDKHFALLEEQLKPDEDVKVCFIGIHNYESPTKHNSYFAYGVTQDRLIMTQKKVIGQNVQVINLNNLNDVTLTTGLVYGVLTFDTYKEKFNVAVDKTTAKNIHDMATNAIFSQVKENKEPTQPAMSVADEILKYNQLLEAGAITKEEYEALKSNIIG